MPRFRSAGSCVASQARLIDRCSNLVKGAFDADQALQITRRTVGDAKLLIILLRI